MKWLNLLAKVSPVQRSSPIHGQFLMFFDNQSALVIFAICSLQYAETDNRNRINDCGISPPYPLILEKHILQVLTRKDKGVKEQLK